MHFPRGLALVTAAAAVAAADASTVENRATAIELGLSPQVLVIAGGDADDVAIVVGAIGAATSLRDLVAQRRHEADSIVVALSEFNERVQREAMTESDRAYGAELRAGLAAARDAITAAETLLRASVLTAVDQVETQLIYQQIQSVHRSVPAEFRVLDLGDADWRLIERALKRESAHGAASLSAEESALLESIRSNADVLAAKERLEFFLDDARAAF